MAALVRSFKRDIIVSKPGLIERAFYPHNNTLAKVISALAEMGPKAVREAYAIYFNSLVNPEYLVSFGRQGDGALAGTIRIEKKAGRIVISRYNAELDLSTDRLAGKAIKNDEVFYIYGNKQFSIPRTGPLEVKKEQISASLEGSRLVLPLGPNYGVTYVYGPDLRYKGLWPQHRSVAAFGRHFANLFALREIGELDPLTGLKSKRTFGEERGERIKDYLESGIDTSLLMFDIDYFKDVNDTYGHLAGDKVLAACAAIVSMALRSEDSVSVGRVGGEEFAMLLPGADDVGAAIAAERVRRLVESTPIFFEGFEIPVTGSIGSASVSLADRIARGEVQIDPERLLTASEEEIASQMLVGNKLIFPSNGEMEARIEDILSAVVDGALYRAKELGRNLVVAATVEKDNGGQILRLRAPK